MLELREKKNDVKIVPRFMCSEFNGQLYAEWLKEENVEHFLKILLRRLKYNKFDGMVLECNHLWMMEDIYAQYSNLIKRISEMLKKENKMFILVIYPYAESFINTLNKARFEYLSRYVDYFSVMSYDYISYMSKSVSKFNAPLSWITRTIEHYIDLSKPSKDFLTAKLLLGLPFHGILTEKDSKDAKGSHLDGSSFSTLLSQVEGDVDLSWDKDECEHLINLKRGNKDYVASYPTKKVINYT
jgi:spore germination protein YaaH